MASQYAATHARALAAVATKGAPVTFTHTTHGAHTPSTDAFSAPSVVTVTGKAIEDEGDPEEYRALELIGQSPATLFFVPDTLGQLPPRQSAVSWAGSDRTVREVFPLRPDGTAIAARVVVL
jgi:hypothetical protein